MNKYCWLYLALVLFACVHEIRSQSNNTETSEASSTSAQTSEQTSLASSSDEATSQQTSAQETSAQQTSEETSQSLGPMTTGVAVTTGFSTTGVDANATYPPPTWTTYISENANPFYIQPQAGIACVTPAPNQFHRPHKYYRIFPLSEDYGITGEYQLTAVSFGIERAIARTLPCQPVSIQIYYKNDANTVFTDADLFTIVNVTAGVPDMRFGFLTVAVSATIPPGKTMVIIFETIDGLPTASTLFMGANLHGEYSPSYLSTSSCRLDTPTPYTSIGFNTSLVWIVTNETNPQIPTYECACVPNSCTRYCAAKPPCGTSDCWCDGACAFYNDCCSDFQPVCAGVNFNNTIGSTISQEFTNDELSTTTGSNNGDGGLTAGEKAGIAVGVIVGVIIASVVAVIVIAFVIFQVRRAKLRKAKLAQYKEELEMKDGEKI